MFTCKIKFKSCILSWVRAYDKIHATHQVELCQYMYMQRNTLIIEITPPGPGSLSEGSKPAAHAVRGAQRGLRYELHGASGEVPA